MSSRGPHNRKKLSAMLEGQSNTSKQTDLAVLVVCGRGRARGGGGGGGGSATHALEQRHLPVAVPVKAFHC